MLNKKTRKETLIKVYKNKTIPTSLKHGHPQKREAKIEISEVNFLRNMEDTY
jgi:hypothetical protein